MRLFRPVFLIITIVILMLVADLALAAGDGSGGGQNNPLSLQSSSPLNNQKDFKPTDKIKLTFNKNVSNQSVKDKNKTSFSLVDAGGSSIPIEVIMVDDQINPEENNIVIRRIIEPKILGSSLGISALIQTKTFDCTVFSHV